MIVKDFVKSRKHEWAEACFIPSAADRGAVERVVGRFLNLQGDDLAEGLVLREYVEFQPVGAHPRRGMPLTEEHRAFWPDGVPVLLAPYWAEGNYRSSIDRWLRARLNNSAELAHSRGTLMIGARASQEILPLTWHRLPPAL